MASMDSPHFQTPLCLFVSAISRLRAIPSARALERQRWKRKRELARNKAVQEGVINKNN